MMRSFATLVMILGSLACWLTPGTSYAQQTALQAECLAGDPESQAEACTAAIQEPGVGENAKHNLQGIRGLVLFRQGDFAEARRDLEATLARVPDAEQIKQALDAIDQIERSSGLTSQQALSACTYWRDKPRRLDACDQFVKLVASSSGDQAAALTLRGTVKVSVGNGEDGLKDLQAAARLSPQDRRIASALAKGLWDSGHYDEAKTAIDRLVAQGDDRATWAAQYGALAYRDGHLDEAAKLLDQVDPLAPDSGLHLFRAALVRAEIAKSDGGAFSRVALTQRDGSFAQGLLDFRRGTKGEADLRRAVASLPQHDQIRAICMMHFSIGQKLALSNDTNGARKEFQAAVTTCRAGEFEHVAADSWLKRMGK